jgi:hypothetical protein
VLIDEEGKSHIVRENENLEDIIRNEIIPNHLK